VKPREAGLLALDSIERLILELRSLYDKGLMPDQAWITEEWAPAAAAHLRDLDLYLTDKDEGRREADDIRRLVRFAMELETYHVHLSDGGYSRITLRPEDGTPVSLDRSLSLRKPVERWDALRARP
jgi:hypothetical protein